jgi:hypothetical protein
MCLRIDPRDFISAPYVACSRCGKDSFGVLTIGPDHYLRRCRNCLYPTRPERPASFPLPPLHKEIIYVDQFAVSNMMKALNPCAKAHKKDKLDAFWCLLFQHLDSLCKLQLIVCPESGSHKSESLLSPYFDALRRMYELLSGGVRFREYGEIKIAQICEHAANWGNGKPAERIALSAKTALEGDLDGWTDRIMISVKGDWNVDWIHQLRQDRKRVCERLNQVVTRWKTEKDKDFHDWFSEETSGYGNVIWRDYCTRLKRMVDVRQGRIPWTTDDLDAPYALSFRLVESLKFTFQQAGFDQSRIEDLVVEYLKSAPFEDVPFIRVSAMLFATVARKFAHGGRRKPINEGLATDIDIISVLLPYCDAAFIDNECETYLHEKPLCDLWEYKTKFFSLNKRNDFLEYLVGIRKAASKEHLAKVEEVYGLNAQEPFTTLYTDS